MAEASVVDLPAAVISWVKSVDVYKTPARIICFTAAEARAGNGPSSALNAPEPHGTSSVWGMIPASDPKQEILLKYIQSINSTHKAKMILRCLGIYFLEKWIV